MSEGVTIRQSLHGGPLLTKAGVWMSSDADARLMLATIERALRDTKSGTDRDRLMRWRGDVLRTVDQAHREGWEGWER